MGGFATVAEGEGLDGGEEDGVFGAVGGVGLWEGEEKWEEGEEEVGFHRGRAVDVDDIAMFGGW